MDINNGIIKLVRSLRNKRDRDSQGLFMAEGTKCVRDTWGSFPCHMLIATRSWFDRFGTAAMQGKLVLATSQAMKRISQFDTASEVLAVYAKPKHSINDEQVRSSLNLVLDKVQDPGNLGTIMRLADWYGITDVFASEDTVDVYNHKAVQATMGAIARVRVHYCDLPSLLSRFDGMPVYGTFLLNSQNIYSTPLSPTGFVALGNEGGGISAQVSRHVTTRLTIPAWPRQGAGSESLNVGMAAAVVLSEFRRNALAGVNKAK